MIVDLVAYDREDRPIALVEVKPRRLRDQEVESYRDRYLTVARERGLRFLMLVDYGQIRVYDLRAEKEFQPVYVGETSQIFDTYDPNLKEVLDARTIYERCLSALAGAWLRDLAYRRESDSPPGLTEMARIGLLSLLDGGTTRREVELDAAPVS